MNASHKMNYLDTQERSFLSFVRRANYSSLNDFDFTVRFESILIMCRRFKWTKNVNRNAQEIFFSVIFFCVSIVSAIVTVIGTVQHHVHRNFMLFFFFGFDFIYFCVENICTRKFQSVFDSFLLLIFLVEFVVHPTKFRFVFSTFFLSLSLDLFSFCATITFKWIDDFDLSRRKKRENFQIINQNQISMEKKRTFFVNQTREVRWTIEHRHFCLHILDKDIRPVRVHMWIYFAFVSRTLYKCTDSKRLIPFECRKTRNTKKTERKNKTF